MVSLRQFYRNHDNQWSHVLGDKIAEFTKIIHKTTPFNYMVTILQLRGRKRQSRSETYNRRR